tara:strand:+ start:1488 stop:2063 length:576 start_codon:yes stop_codon:yes gene_type:complete
MINLYNLIQTGLIEDGHTIFFLYKGSLFEGIINALGVIYKSYCSQSDDGHRVEIFTERLPFESLSNWADSCIQDICKEYVTRFSAWKRLKHKESGLSMQSLRYMYNQFFLQRLPLTNISVNTLRQYVSVFLKHIEALHEEIYQWGNYVDGYQDNVPKKTIAPIHLEMLKVNFCKFLSDKKVIEIQLDEQRV